MGLRPVVVGYQRLWACSSPQEAEDGLRRMRTCAERAGFALGTTYAETAADYRAIDQALTAIERGEVHGLVVASASDLGDLPRVRNFMRGMIAKAGARLLIAEDITEDIAEDPAGHVDLTGRTGMVDRSPDPVGLVMTGLGLMGATAGMVPQTRRAQAGS